MTGTPGDRRRRFAKACDSCRRKKLRCDGVRPLCARCQDANTPCHYADVHKPESRQRRGRDSTRTPRRRDDEQDAGSSIATASPTALRAHAPGIEASSGLDGAVSARTDNAEPITPAREEGPQILSSVARFSGQTGNSIPNNSAGGPDTIVGRNVDTRYFGPASGISLVSARTSSRESDAPKRHAAQHRFQEGSWSAWTHPSVQGMLEKRVSRPLPSWTEAFSLVSEFFNYEHQTFPCFHPPTFMTLLGQQYSETPSDSPAWWASLNAVLAISQRRRLESGRCDSSGDELVWSYAANALGTMLDILMRNTQLISVQALLCTAWFFLGTPNPQPSFMLTGSAVRLAHSIGLHKRDHGSSLGAIEQEMRTKVFWIALSLDRELCLRTGRPPAHDLYHFQVDLPPDSVHDDSEVMATSDGSKLRLARSQAQLCVIQDHIYDELYSSRSSNETTRITESVARLTSQLEEWCASVPGFHAHQSVPGGEHHGLIRLYYSYYNCVVLVHRPLARQYWLSSRPATNSDLSPSIKISIGQCLTAARSIIRMLEVVPHQHKSFYWDVVPIILSAIVILSTNLRTSQSDATRDDLEAISKVVRLFSALDEETNGTYLSQVRKLCEELYEAAHIAFQSRQGHAQYHPQQQVQTGTDNVGGTHHSESAQGAQAVYADTIRVGDAHMLPGSMGGNNPTGIEPQLPANLFQMAPWPPTVQAFSYADLSPWSLDMLSGGLFPPLS